VYLHFTADFIMLLKKLFLLNGWCYAQVDQPSNSLFSIKRFFISAQMDQATVAWSSCAQKSHRLVYGF